MIGLTERVIAARGVCAWRVWRRGVLVEDATGANLIVNGSKALLASLLGGAVSSNSVTQIGFGTGLTAPAGGNTALTSPYTKAVDSVSYPVSGSVQFNFSLGSAEANGKAIGEFGLFSAGGVLVARKVRASALAKDSDISLSGTWTISF